jgi:uncharacterized protein (TIGR01777 family)
MKNILITGGTGLVGSKLIPKLEEAGYEVAVLSRKPQKSGLSFVWDIKTSYIDPKAIAWCDHVIHLAGAGIADKRWTDSRKKEIISSRVAGLKLIQQELNAQNKKLQTFVSASGMGYFSEENQEKVFTEEDDFGTDFPAIVCEKWENEAQKLSATSYRLVIIRIGIVLDKDGGALPKLLPIFKFGLGSAIGSGRQIMPWIHMDDLLHIFVQSISNSNIQGVYNAVAQNPVNNKEFGKHLAKILKKPFFLPNVPAFILKIMMGEMSQLVLHGGNVSNEKIQGILVDFKFSKVEEAFQDILN